MKKILKTSFVPAPPFFTPNDDLIGAFVLGATVGVVIGVVVEIVLIVVLSVCGISVAVDDDDDGDDKDNNGFGKLFLPSLLSTTATANDRKEKTNKVRIKIKFMI